VSTAADPGGLAPGNPAPAAPAAGVRTGQLAGELAIEVVGVVKSFGTVRALRGVDLMVRPGALAALLGPNGAGKTTLVRIIATLARQDAGRVSVLGHDVLTQPYAVRSLIGLTGQYAGLEEALPGRDNLVLIGRLAGLRRTAARRRAAELAERFGLTEAAARPVRTYSGGMRRRLDLAASLMNKPALLILDEPTTGLDPAGRIELWAALAELRTEGTTMLLTTQYLEEADRFADTVHVLNDGLIIAAGTAAQLKARTGIQVVDVLLADRGSATDAARVLATVAGTVAPHAGALGELNADEPSRRLTVVAPDGLATLLTAAEALRASGIGVADIALRQPSLDEAFLALTSGNRP
jgi:ABC-type multidrug transport system ATPase subunit